MRIEFTILTHSTAAVDAVVIEKTFGFAEPHGHKLARKVNRVSFRRTEYNVLRITDIRLDGVPRE